MAEWLDPTVVLKLTVALGLVVLNGFFVAAEFALVKVRGSRLELLAESGTISGRTASWLGARLDHSLSACQLGITLASLALGWIGEPAFEVLLIPILNALGIDATNVVHTVSFIFAFSTITALHLVIGEQAPKIFAIRRPEKILLKCAIPMAVFYFVTYPLLVALSRTTDFLLKMVGMVDSDSHEVPHTEDEIRTLVTQAHAHGELTGSEHHLINAVFEFDDLICRRVMVPRSQVVFFRTDQPIVECLTIIRDTMHSRYPVCNGQLEDVVGVLHIKDLVGLADPKMAKLKVLARTAHHVPETMSISRLLKHFQATHQLMAIVDDEHGTVVGVVTLENVLEQIVGSVEDEFDLEETPLQEDGMGGFIATGNAPLSLIRERLQIEWAAKDVDTLSGYLTLIAGQPMQDGDRLEIDDIQVEVVEVDGMRATRIRLRPRMDG
ncbi:MAG TPA: HlyC/CorC family transporter [Planctomycetes bacterium]|nr:HlyC/CorC family transporter [Planctomycetaceae bacterium]HIM29399.1 HlyC/CorC family transporter [Planctomycetota bacterium]